MASLKNIRAALQSSNSENSVYWTSLIDGGKLSPYGSKPGSLVRRRFGPSDASFPRIGKKTFSFASRNPDSIRGLVHDCLRELNNVRDCLGCRQVYIISPNSAEDFGPEREDETSADIVSKIVKTLDSWEPGLDSVQDIITFQSRILDNMRIDAFIPADDVLHTSMTTFTHLPSNTPIPIQHTNEGTTTINLLSGSVFWIIWPPTPRNLQALQTAYNNFSEDLEEDKLEISQDLEGGIVLLQSEGEGLRIPPFCPMMSFASQTSVLASYSTVTVDDFISVLQRATLLDAFFKTEHGGEQKQNAFNAQVLRWLGFILNGEIDPDSKNPGQMYRPVLTDDGPLQTLLRFWDKAKEDVATLLGPENATVVQDIWSTFLIDSKGRECRLCGKRINNKRKLMRPHFIANHWPKEISTERVDSMEVNMMEEDEGDDEIDTV